jgi:hypothetical protein
LDRKKQNELSKSLLSISGAYESDNEAIGRALGSQRQETEDERNEHTFEPKEEQMQRSKNMVEIGKTFNPEQKPVSHQGRKRIYVPKEQPEAASVLEEAKVEKENE